MNAIRLAAFLILVLLSPALAATEELCPPTGFQSLQWGASIEQVRSALPTIMCTRLPEQKWPVADWGCQQEILVNEVPTVLRVGGFDTSNPSGFGSGLSIYTMDFSSDQVEQIKKFLP
jgi:hypothetical protein